MKTNLKIVLDGNSAVMKTMYHNKICCCELET